MTKVAFLATVLAFIAYTSASAQDTSYGFYSDLCDEEFSSVVSQLVEQDTIGTIATYELLETNEFRCERSHALEKKESGERQEDTENQYDDMANALITITLDTGEKYWTIVHIHFYFSKDDVSVSAFPEWRRFSDEQVPFKEWCQFVQYVYPKDLHLYNCT
jgi:hypothetical protein